MITNNLSVSIVQCCSGLNQQKNFDLIEPIVLSAVTEGAEFISMPEAVNTMSYKTNTPLYCETDDAFVCGMQNLAQQNKVWLHLGSVIIKENNKTYNRSIIIDGNGKIHQRYNKIHMFDIELDGETIRESDSFSAGSTIVSTDTPWGKIGLSICYDLRFPTMYRQLSQQGCRLLLVPAAFTYTTGKAHWHTLLRARAIENSAWIVAANQSGKHEDRRITYGHSLVIDPWGEIVAENNNKIGQTTVTIDLFKSNKVREQIPAWRLD